MKKVWMFSVLLMVAVGLTACGGGDTSNSTRLMGGSMQGKALLLANTVSTIAGPPITEAIDAANFTNPNGIIRKGTDLFVADANNCTIRRVDIATGAVTTIAGTTSVSGSADGTGAAASFNWPAGITTDGANLFVTDRVNNNIRKIVISSGVVTTIAGTAGVSGSSDGTGVGVSFTAPKGITTDGTNLFVSDSGNHTIRKIVIATGVVTTIAGTAGVSGTADGSGTAARFNNPYGIITVGVNLFVADAYNHSIRRIVISTGAVTTIAGTAGASGAADGTGTAASFDRPYGITTDGINLFVADYVNCSIRKIVIATGEVTTIAGTAGLRGMVDDTGAAARFSPSVGITTDGANLFVSDSGNNAIRKVVISTRVVTTIAGTERISGATDGSGATAKFYAPAGVTTDGTNLYIAENINNTIRKVVISTGAVTTIAGTAGVPGSADGTGAAANFNWPNGITTDGTNLFITEAGNNTIRKIVIATGVVTTIAGTAGVSGSADGTGAVAQFNSPSGITTNGVNLFVTDTGNSTIRQIVISSGVVTTISGTADVPGSADGTGTVAQFNAPYDITTDGGKLFITDRDNHTIRQIVIASGVVTTIAGKVGETVSVDGTGITASFNDPAGITTDGSSLFVADHNAIRRIVISTGVVTTIAGTADVRGFVNGSGTSAKFNGPDGITTDGTSLFVADNNSHLIRRIQ